VWKNFVTKNVHLDSNGIHIRGGGGDFINQMRYLIYWKGHYGRWTSAVKKALL
jgi:hypothetical protein